MNLFISSVYYFLSLLINGFIAWSPIHLTASFNKAITSFLIKLLVVLFATYSNIPSKGTKFYNAYMPNPDNNEITV